MSTWAIVLAVGKDQEIATGADTAFMAMSDRPVLAYSLAKLEACPLVDGIILVISKAKVDVTLKMVRQFGVTKVKSIVGGGAGRLASLKKAMGQLPERANAIMIHEASRPFVSQDVLVETIKAGKRYGAAVAAMKSLDAVKYAEKGQKVSKLLDRGSVWLAQTPQAFKREIFEKMLKSGTKVFDDESALLEGSRQEIHLVVSTAMNMKIRTAKDLEAASAMLSIV